MLDVFCPEVRINVYLLWFYCVFHGWVAELSTQMLKSPHERGKFREKFVGLIECVRTVRGVPRPKYVDFFSVFANPYLFPAKLEHHLQTLEPSPKRQVCQLIPRKNSCLKAVSWVSLESDCDRKPNSTWAYYEILQRICISRETLPFGN